VQIQILIAKEAEEKVAAAISRFNTGSNIEMAKL